MVETVPILMGLCGSHPTEIYEAQRDRAVGALVGLAVGDAVGTTLEFRSRDSYPPLTDMIGGGPFELNAGQWTDDTSMALALAASLMANPDLDPADLMGRFVAWRDHGDYSCVGHCFDIGHTVSQALHQWEQTGDPIAGSTDPKTAGNGSLMRLAPVALVHWRDRTRLADVASRQSLITHGAPEAVSACQAFAHLLADAILGEPREAVLKPRPNDYAGEIAPIIAGRWWNLPRSAINSSGYVAHSLEVALWATSETQSFEASVLLAANLGGDADTSAAITGQLAGAIYGLSGIPEQWVEKLAWGPAIVETARELFGGEPCPH